MDLEKESSDTSAVEESDNGSEASLSDENSDEDDMDDDYFRKYVDVGVEDGCSYLTGKRVLFLHLKSYLKVLNIDFVFVCKSYVASYFPVIEPINRYNMWEKADIEPIDPPTYHKLPGWPPKKRKGGDDENTIETAKEKRENAIVKCSNCHKHAHNRRSCKEPLTSNASSSKQPKKKNTRPKLPIQRNPQNVNQSSCTQESINTNPPGAINLDLGYDFYC
ncbi:hypothetical protein K1719_033609 [Acacia pycnantha]|nr:hypothetical protein K1719_033609 [Acacia pycnantha]